MVAIVTSTRQKSEQWQFGQRICMVAALVKTLEHKMATELYMSSRSGHNCAADSLRIRGNFAMKTCYQRRCSDSGSYVELPTLWGRAHTCYHNFIYFCSFYITVVMGVCGDVHFTLPSHILLFILHYRRFTLPSSRLFRMCVWGDVAICVCACVYGELVCVCVSVYVSVVGSVCQCLYVCL